MTRRLRLIFAILLFVEAPPCGFTQKNTFAQVYFDARQQQMEYVGPGRDEPEPANLCEVLIGYFGPSNPAHPEGGDIWRAVNLAIEEANAEGGYRGLPFRVLPAWSENPWGTGVGELVRLAYYDKVWAIIGGVDGPSTHLAEQVVAKARLVLISPASTDKTVNLAGVPWMFSVSPGDHLTAPVIGGALLAGHDRFVTLAATDHDSHMFLVELRKFLATKGAVPIFEYEFKSGARDFSELATRLEKAKAEAVVLIAGPSDSARLLATLRGKDFSGQVFGGPGMARRTFLSTAGTAAEGVLFPLIEDLATDFQGFAAKYQSRLDVSPDFAAAQAYDATRLLITAIRKAGLNRARICDAVRGLSPWDGVSGTIMWDPAGGNVRKIRLGRIQSGRVQPLHRDLNCPQPMSPGNRGGKRGVLMYDGRPERAASRTTE
jgi:branched-chain amino acid transport system substrate-binding protein